MPNWCSNEMNIKGKKEDLDLLLEKANNEEENNPLSLDKLFPTENTGKEDGWYEWRLANWGTKWDLSDVELERLSDDEISVRFSTAWSPPLEAFVKISKDYPEIEFSVFYSEPGADFCGKAEISNGSVDDKCVSYSEQFGCGLEFNIESARNDGDDVTCEVNLTSASDPYDLDADIQTIKWKIVIPNSIEGPDDVEDSYEDIDFILLDESSDQDFFDKYYDSEYYIKDKIADSLNEIRKSANYHSLNEEVENKESKNKSKKRKI